MSGNNTGGFQPDLFGGQASSYVDKDGNVVTMTQTEADKLENESRGGTNDYPHSTHKTGDTNWHFSNSRTSDRVQSTAVPSEDTDGDAATGEDRTQSLF